MNADLALRAAAEAYEAGRVMRAWEAFLSGEPLPLNSVRKMILRSWRRCRVQRTGRLRKAPLDRTRLARPRPAHQELGQVAALVPRKLEPPPVIAAARCIEILLHNREMRRRTQPLEAWVDRPPGQGRDARLLLDRRGHLLRSNERAAAVLGARGIDAVPRPGPSLGAQPPVAAGVPPSWLKPEWLQAVHHQHQPVGRIVVIPAPAATPRTAIPAPRDDEAPAADLGPRLQGHRCAAMLYRRLRDGR